MEYLERGLLQELKKWMDRREILAIKGPRQSGKTTLLEMLKGWLTKEKGVNEENIIFLTFEDRENLEGFEQDPKRFIGSFLRNGSRHYFLLDEVHYVKDCGQKLKLVYDLFKNVKFVVTGSSSLELTSATARFLVGRVFSFELMPLDFREFLLARDRRMAKVYEEWNSAIRRLIIEGRDFRSDKEIFLRDLLRLLGDFLVFGGYPAVVKAESEEEKRMVLKGIYNTYIEKDIVSFLKIDDSIRFKKLVSALSSMTGKMVKYETLTATANSYFKEITKWVDILEQTYIIRMVRPFHRNLVTELRKNPKVYFIDPGLRNYAINDFSPLNSRSDRGELAENFVFNQLKPENINYWRTAGKAEVDFIADTGRGILPIEVKFEEMRKETVPKGLQSFIEAYSPGFAIIATKDFFGERGLNSTKVKFIPLVYF
jgi:predicted AAA+ superfamily ATPase